MSNVQHIYKGSGAPGFAPAEEGHHYVDITNKIHYVSVGTATDADWIQVGSTPTGSANTISRYDSSGLLDSANGWTYDTTLKGVSQNITFQPNNLGGATFNNHSIAFDPLQNSPNESYNWENKYIDIDPNSTGFSIGSGGNFGSIYNLFFNHQGTSNIGNINFITQSYALGNGTDAISVNGVAYIFGFGVINANVTVTGPFQGYGFQPNVNAAATVNSYVQAFYDAATFSTPVAGYSSLNLGPQIAGIKNNSNYSGVSINPSIPVFTGNAGFTGIGIFPNLGTFNSGSFQGIVMNPAITSMSSGGFIGYSASPTIGNTKNATGIDINMSNVTPYPGAKSSLTVQDLFIESLTNGDNNNISIEYVNDGTAGSETAVLVLNAITVHIQSGVSTATQVRAAILANVTLAANLSVTITGVGSNPQVTYGPTNFAGGEAVGNVKAANFQGDVNINGAFSFTGALAVGKIQAFASQALTDGGGAPSSVHTLITAPTIADNLTVANADLLGVNTAALITIGTNSVVTTGFIGIAALGLPAVLSMGAGSTVDLIEGAIFALSLDSGAAGGTVDTVALCRSLAIPNGATTVNKLYGYDFRLPFGPVGTKHWGFYTDVDCDNWFKGSLKIGGTAGSTDQVTNTDIGLEVEDAFIVIGRGDTTARNAKTAINGAIWYNTTTDKFQGYAGGVWTDLN
jgi:hypothetical protein